LLYTKNILALCESSSHITLQDRSSGLLYYYDYDSNQQKNICIIIDSKPNEDLTQSLGFFVVAHKEPITVVLISPYFSDDTFIIAANFELYFASETVKKYRS
jgi:hypothetical protein